MSWNVSIKEMSFLKKRGTKMCDVCLRYKCPPQCPNYETPSSPIKCSVCGEYIYDGEEYVEEYVSKDTNKNKKEEYRNKTILVEPRAFSEAQQIADYLKAKNQVVVNFKRVTSDVSKRIMDFLNGIVYAIEGSMQKLGPGIVICAPKGFEIEGNITEDDTKKTKKADTGEW